MKVTKQQTQLVQNSFSTIVSMADETATLFYGRLFVLEPSLQDLFKNDMSEQRGKLMRTLQVAVRGLNNVEALTPILQGLAMRHVAYGVRDAHYATVGSALLWALEQGLGEAWTDEVHEAWTAVYALFSSIMRGATHNDAGGTSGA